MKVCKTKNNHSKKTDICITAQSLSKEDKTKLNELVQESLKLLNR